MATSDAESRRVPRRWGGDRALRDDEEARRLLLRAATRCIVRHGSAQIRMAEVADEAAVARSTLYRYFPTRADLILGLSLSRLDAALTTVVSSLRHPDDAARSLPELVLGPLDLVDGHPLNEALYSPESSQFVTSVELNSESFLDTSVHRYGPLLERWQREGQVHADLDVQETLRWVHAVSIFLLAPPWRQRSREEKRAFLERYLVRALVVPRSADRGEEPR